MSALLCKTCGTYLLHFSLTPNRYANPWLVLPLFVAPSWAAALWSLENDMKETSAWTSFMMFFMFLALLTCYFELGFSYLPVIWCVSCISPRIAFSKKNKCLVVLLGSVLPLVLTSQLLFFAFDFFIPLMGRAGTEAYPDTVIAVRSLFLSPYIYIIDSFLETHTDTLRN